MSIKNKRRVSKEGGHAGDLHSFAFKGVPMSKKPKNNKQQSFNNHQLEAQKKAAHFELRHIKPLTPNQERVFNDNI